MREELEDEFETKLKSELGFQKKSLSIGFAVVLLLAIFVTTGIVKDKCAHNK